jgi:serine phosphatase RsbU (regulator of sigma subunit)
MEDLKIKVWGLIYLSRKQILIFELVVLTLFVLITVFLFSYEFPQHQNETFNFHAKYAKYMSLACTFLIIVEMQFLWSQFTELQLEEIIKQKEKIEQQNRMLKDSIKYASRIQSALLPSKPKMERLLKNHFLYFEPRDIVSGDFYWIDEYNGKIIVAVADCTGHGVPGAFVSVLGISFLNDIIQKASINEQELTPAVVLDNLRQKLWESLTRSETESKTYDGMDIAVCMIDSENGIIEFSGAIHPIYIVRKNSGEEKEIEKVKTDKHSISMFGKNEHSYHTTRISLSKNDMIYMFSDGYADQFGGKSGRKFLTKKF